MELTPEDTLRLNVLLANKIQAIRIDESKMRVYGLSEQGEAQVQLHPNCHDDRYLRKVRELISGHVLGSPGGYPVYLRRWHRMGQTKGEHLEHLLMLGEPEAIMAVVNAPGLTPELARRAWWARADADTARSMLKNPAIVHSALGKQLAAYLIDYLAFETEVFPLIESVRLVLQADLIEPQTRQHLWQKGQTKTAYLVGFLLTTADELPEPLPARADAEALHTALYPLIAEENQLAQQLLQVVSSGGQSFIHTCEQILRKPATQEVVNLLFDIIAHYFRAIRPPDYAADMTIITLINRAQSVCMHCEDRHSRQRRQILVQAPQLEEMLSAMFILSGLNYSILRPIFSRTTAVGSLMRKKLAPVSEPIMQQFAVLKTAVME